MKARNRFGQTLTSILLIVISSLASARVVTLDFDDPKPAGTSTSHLVQAASRIGPSCQYDLGRLRAPGCAGRQWSGFDGTHCSRFFNQDFSALRRGPSNPAFTFEVLRIDYSGWPFALSSSFDSTSDPKPESSGSGLWEATELSAQSTIEFEGLHWSAVKWLLLNITGGSGAALGFDHFVAQVPEPTTSHALIGLGLAGLLVARRRMIGQRIVD